MAEAKLKVGVVGGTGYTGVELLRLLSRHPGVELHAVTSREQAGRPVADLFQNLRSRVGLAFAPPEPAVLAACDAVFFAAPNGTAMAMARGLLEAGVRIIDLAADFRLKDPAEWRHWYRMEHACPELLTEAVYGLPEINRTALRGARLVANPGCYPTSVLLALRPLLLSDIAISGPIIADSASGVSGAGRGLSLTTHFVEVADNYSPYKIGRAHRHLPEMEQAVGWWREAAPAIIFSPHLLPVPRGILSTIYVNLAEEVVEAELRALYTAAYDGEPFVDVLPAGELASLAHVTHTNRCAIALTLTGRTLILTSAIDNLIKGAAGQAVQNMNVMFGHPETLGLL